MRGTGEDLLHFIHGCLLDPVESCRWCYGKGRSGICHIRSRRGA
jgi:hypothetical protein